MFDHSIKVYDGRGKNLLLKISKQLMLASHRKQKKKNKVHIKLFLYNNISVESFFKEAILEAKVYQPDQLGITMLFF